ncbi:hypothetical protein PSA7680_00157 [Pseudoruegeria aquimaris]|uniref:Hedgehog/Intein (Hint) domain-containing protein n=1 Tax=Pseudoruegeria aquimaris TaxID=393663 RepID=A0A1Y5RAF1_9RHOB|nr:Hint domain-containing protein [Pseudoruegeria aquimaris]SLN11725.1 hypothetical protein PSA7680_00157 [Pseudoruegeria aquimaris]
MPTNSFYVYNTGALNVSGGTISLDPNFNAADDRWILEITDDDNQLDGDFSNNEQGYDANQTGVLYETDGTTLANPGGGPVNGDRVYAENQLLLTGSDGSLITIYVMESGGTFVGYLPTAPLTPGVTYAYTSTNVIGNDEVAGTFWNFFYGGTDETDPTTYVDPSTGESNIIGAVVCFTPDALVRTPDGMRPIGGLRRGDQVMTRDNGYQEIRWLHRRRLTQADLRANPHLAPIVIERGAMGPDTPFCRTRVSPQHRILVASPMNEMLFGTEVTLAPAKGLIDGKRIWQDHRCRSVEYVHLLFDSHEILEADGLQSESFHPGDWTMGHLPEEALRELFEIFPSLARRHESYGPAAYPALSVREARLLVA